MRRVALRLLTALLLASAIGPRCIAADEYYCEEAAAYLESCCGRSLGLFCEHYQPSSGGCSGARGPDLLPAQSACLRRQSCQALKAAGFCEISAWSLQSCAPSTCTDCYSHMACIPTYKESPQKIAALGHLCLGMEKNP